MITKLNQWAIPIIWILFPNQIGLHTSSAHWTQRIEYSTFYATDILTADNISFIYELKFVHEILERKQHYKNNYSLRSISHFRSQKNQLNC